MNPDLNLSRVNDEFKLLISCACSEASRCGSAEDYGKLMKYKRAFLKHEHGACLSDKELEWLVNMAKLGGYVKRRSQACAT